MASILIIDDDAPAAGVLTSLLAREGYDTTHALTATEAIGQMRRAAPDLVLLDLSMPVTDGLDLLDAIADEPTFGDVRVAVFSGRADDESKRLAAKLGAVDYIPKGLAWPQLRERIVAALSAEPIA